MQEPRLPPQQPPTGARPTGNLALRVHADYIGAFHRLYAPLAAACGVLAVVPWVVYRDDAPVEIASAAMAFLALLLLLAHVTFRGGVLRGGRAFQLALHLPIGACIAALAYFMGPHSGMAAFLAALFVLIGLTGTSTPWTRVVATTAAASIALGQAILVGLVVTEVIPDRALFPIVPAEIEPWRIAVTHGVLQGIYGLAFFAGIAYRRRYAAVAHRADEATRSAIRRDALLAEARAEHQRALVASVQGAFAGQRLGPYKLGELVARGGMGEIYDAVASDGGSVAVKVLRGDRLSDGDAVARLRDEVRALKRVEDPHIARLYDAGGGGGELPYIAMERLEGRNLAAIARTDGPLPSAELHAFVDQVGQALEAVHGAGLVHRDVSPNNLVRGRAQDRRPLWKLIDMGSAVASQTESDGATLGTLRYMAPEQLRGEPANARADVYGFGMCLYLAATGEPPYADATVDLLTTATGAALPIAPRALAPVTTDLERVLRIAIAREPGDRFATPSEFAAAARAALDGALDAQSRQRADRLTAKRPWTWPATDATFDDPTDVIHAHGAPPTNLHQGDVVPAVAAPRRELWPELELETEPEPAPAPRPSDETQATVELPLHGQRRAAPASAIAGTREQTDTPPPVLAKSARGMWEETYLEKMLTAGQAVMVACVLGIPLMALLAPQRGALEFASICVVALFLLCGQMVLALRKRGARRPRRPDRIVMVMLSVGPAYFVGMTSAFVAVLGAYLYNVGMGTQVVRASKRLPWVEVGILAGVIIAHSIWFTLIVAGHVPDAGIYPVLVPDSPLWEPIATHIAIQCGYILVFGVAYIIERRYAALLDATDEVAREAASKRALLDTARIELRRTLSEGGDGIFTGHRIGNYKLGALLGRGAMGEVYDATHFDSGQRAALKLIRGDRLGDERSLRGFLREAQALSRVSSEQVARIYEVGDLDGELPHIAMEFLEGEDLASLLRRGERLTAEDLAALICDVAAGLQAVHSAGIVHRDIKPANIVITTPRPSTARWKLVDFGVAKVSGPASGTTGRYLIGTPAYMAPEQASSGKVDERADLYSFGLVIYRVLAGRPAFVGNSIDVLRVIQDGVPDPRYYAVMSEDVELVLRIATAPEPRDRFDSANEMAVAFAAAFAGELAAPVRERGRGLRARVPWAAR